MDDYDWWDALRNKKPFIPSEDAEKKRKAKELREKVNGVDPEVNPICNCGAKFDRDFPNIHSPFCRAYKDIREWKK
jgi:hypothetical protein